MASQDGVDDMCLACAINTITKTTDGGAIVGGNNRWRDGVEYGSMLIKHESAETSDFSNFAPKTGEGGWSIYNGAGYNLYYEMGYTSNEAGESLTLNFHDVEELTPDEYVAIGAGWNSNLDAYFLKLSERTEDLKADGGGYVHPKIISSWRFVGESSTKGKAFWSIKKDNTSGENDYVVLGAEDGTGSQENIFVMKVRLPDQVGGVIGDEEIIWKKPLGSVGFSEDRIETNLLKLNDGQYIVSYVTTEEGKQKARLVKLVEVENAGVLNVEERWNREAGDNISVLSRIIKAENGAYVAAGVKRENDALSAVLMKYREGTEGGVEVLNTDWQTQIIAGTGSTGNTVENTSDGGYLLGGFAAYNDSNDLGAEWRDLTGGERQYYDVFGGDNGVGILVKYSADGEIVWRGTTKTYIESLERLNDDQYLMGLGQSVYMSRFKDTYAYNINYNFVGDDQPRLEDVSGIERKIIFLNETMDVETSVKGWTFDGWYDNEALTGAEITQVMGAGEINLYGGWERNEYAVTFHVQGNSPTTETITYGDYVSYPEIIEGRTFDGWYTNAEMTEAFDSGTLIAEDTDLWGRWIETPDTREYAVTFSISGRTNGDDNVCNIYYEDTYPYQRLCDINPNPTIVTHGGKVANPGKGDYKNLKFNGWYTDAGLTKPFDFGRPITSNLTLYGKYIDISIIIMPDGMVGGNNDGSAIWNAETNTLTLDNYDGFGMMIAASWDAQENITIELRGENKMVTAADGVLSGIWSYGSLTFSGSGSLEILETTKLDDDIYYREDPFGFCAITSLGVDEPDGTAWLINQLGNVTFNQTGTIKIGDVGDEAINGVCGNVVEVNNGTLAVNSTGLGIWATEAMEMNGGEANIVIKESTQKRRAGIETLIMAMNNGVLNIGGGATGVVAFNAAVIRDGVLNIHSDIENRPGYVVDYGEGNYYNGGIASQNVIFEGGKSNIRSNHMALTVGQLFAIQNIIDEIEISDEIQQLFPSLKAKYNIFEYEDPLVFLGGDITLNGGNTAAIVEGMAQKSTFAGRDYMGVKLDGGLVIDPEDVMFSTMRDEEAFELGDDEDLVEYKTLLANAELEEIVTSVYDEYYGGEVDYITYEGAVKSAHIYPESIDIPLTEDDEENVNTLDAKIAMLTISIFVAIILEGVIIVDLRRRVQILREMSGE